LIIVLTQILGKYDIHFKMFFSECAESAAVAGASGAAMFGWLSLARCASDLQLFRERQPDHRAAELGGDEIKA
jgi:hypothetical protein